MTSEDEARDRVLKAVGCGLVVRVPVVESAGRWAAAAMVATTALPGFDNSAMDGYAVHEIDCGQTDRWLEVAGEVPAGRPLAGVGGAVPPVAPDRAVRVFTGAPLPTGTAAVVMQEDVEVAGDGRIRLREAAAAGDFIRRRGSEVIEGQKLWDRGDRLSAARVGLAASQGWVSLAVTERPRVAVVTTGDEVVAAGQVLPHGAALYNSNGPMLACLARACGAVATMFHVSDDLAEVTATLAEALKEHDLVVVAGGVSVGRHDHVKPALAALGWRPALWRVALKPGKPFLFAERGGQCVFGLPGNPVSALVTFHLFVAPALRKWQGAAASDWPPPTAPATLGNPVANADDRPHYLRGVMGGDGAFTPAGRQESFALFSLSRATALMRVPPATSWVAGRTVTVHPI